MVYISLSNSDHQDAPQAGRRTGLVRVSSVVVTLGIVSMLTDISSESVAAILPLYVTSALGLSTIAYGFIDGLNQGVSAIVRIGGGWVSDRADRPKWIAFAGYALSAVAKVWLLIATGFAAIIAVVTIDRLGKGIRTGPRDVLITAESFPSNLGRSFGVHPMLDTIGAAVGPLLAFLILWLVPTGYTIVFVVTLAAAAVGVIILGLLVPDRRPRREREAAGRERAPFRWRSLTDPRYVVSWWWRDSSACSPSATDSFTSRFRPELILPPNGSPSCTSAQTWHFSCSPFRSADSPIESGVAGCSSAGTLRSSSPTAVLSCPSVAT